MNAEPAWELIVDLSEWDGLVSEEIIVADLDLQRVERNFQLGERDCQTDEDSARFSPRSSLENSVGAEDTTAQADDREIGDEWMQEQIDSLHTKRVETRVEMLRVERDARAAYAVEVGAFGVFDHHDVVDLNHLGNQPTTDYLIEGILERGAITMLFADGYVGKSFMVLDWAGCIATGSRWDSRNVNRGRVLYVALEGHSTFPRRLAAWRQRTGLQIPDGTVQVYPATVNLLDGTSVAALAEYAKQEKFDLVIIDTLSRSIAGGDENSSEQMGKFISSIAQLREAHEPSHIVVLHHSKKDDPEKYRGASVLFDGFDNVLCLRRVKLGTDQTSRDDPHRRLIFQKVKSGQPEPPMDLLFEQELGTGSAVLVRDTRAGMDPVVLHLLDMQKARPANSRSITRAELKVSLVTAGIYASDQSANARLSTLINNGTLGLDKSSSVVSVGPASGKL